jgi:ornithine cyclodeaminase/alanine dehydrogenase-like protein (mu-crystallin family)
LDEGTRVNAIDSHTPDERELDATEIERAKLIVDSREAALKETGDLMIPISQGVIAPDHIFAELGEIVTGRKAGRESEDEITLFKSQGLAIQDVSTATKVYEIATKNSSPLRDLERAFDCRRLIGRSTAVATSGARY